MKKKLSNDYSITVDKMLNMSAEQEAKGFKVKGADFYNPNNGEMARKKILVRENKDYSIEQIFSMMDGKFLLEIEIDGELTYFYSKNLTDLIK